MSDRPADSTDRPETPPSPGRCYDCLRPQSMCYCAQLPTVPTRTGIIVLQHPHERTHPFGTARLVRLCMPNASVHVPIPGFTGTLEHKLTVPDDAAVLFPHPNAPDLAELPPAKRPSTLIAIDGTWSHAKRLYRENPWLHTRPHVRLQPAEPSRYRIRKEPQPDYISTLEAIVAALRIIEPDNDKLDDMLAAFDRMIDIQIAHRSSRVMHRFRVRKPRESRALSPLLGDPRMVVVYAEARRPSEGLEEHSQLLHWVACRIRDEATFEAFIKPLDGGPNDAHLRHLQLERTDLDRGETLDQVQARFANFVEEGAPIAAWTGTTLGWGKAILPQGSPTVLMKSSYCNARQQRAGFLEDIVEREGFTPLSAGLTGRAGARLGNAFAVARWLHQQQLAARTTAE
ncbi:MAG: tRNA-uridine aminocarboxypropyltransferase [Planctomycetota bacterium]